jgi:hypothetical protein
MEKKYTALSDYKTWISIIWATMPMKYNTTNLVACPTDLHSRVGDTFSHPLALLPLFHFVVKKQFITAYSTKCVISILSCTNIWNFLNLPFFCFCNRLRLKPALCSK